MSPSSPLSPQGFQRSLRRNPAARAVWHAIPLARQQRLRRPYERAAQRVALKNRRSNANEVRANAPPSAATLERLREHFAHDAQELARLLGAAPSWQSPAGRS